jgi:tRNA(Ile)-lysidine synthase
VETDRTAASPRKGRRSSAAPRDRPLLVALSGGRDSTALLDLACRLRDQRAPGFGDVRAVHVHHGLQAAADTWAAHCAQLCEALQVPLIVERVAIERDHRRGVEAAAREARYQALAQAAQACEAPVVLTAHHLDDRVETFLLQWLRGAGPAGLAGIAAERALDDGAVRLVRPLLAVPRAEIDRYVERWQLSYVDDPSNVDTRLARNALRLRVVPELEQLRAGFRKSAARSIDLVSEAAEAIQELARGDLGACTADAPGGMLRIDRLAALSPARRSLVLRAWLTQAGIEAPPRARLLEALSQALESGRDARMLIRIGSHELRRHRGLLCLRGPRTQLRGGAERLVWNGELDLPLAAWGGRLRFLPTEEAGFDADWLRERPLEVRARTGGERFKPHPTRPSKRLKQLFQEAGVPEFERAGLPLLWRDDRLIYVARLGADARLVDRGGERVRIDWIGEGSLLGD